MSKIDYLISFCILSSCVLTLLYIMGCHVEWECREIHNFIQDSRVFYFVPCGYESYIPWCHTTTKSNHSSYQVLCCLLLWNIPRMRYFCSPAWNSAWLWFPQQNVNGIFQLAHEYLWLRGQNRRIGLQDTYMFCASRSSSQIIFASFSIF